MRVRAAAAAGVLALGVVLMAACAGESGEPGPEPTATATSPPPESSAPTPLRPSPARPTAPVTGAVTLTGTVAAGVEVGCVLLETEQQDYLLIGEVAEDLPMGETVTVRGRERTDLATICQQGIPFEVTEVLD